MSKKAFTIPEILIVLLVVSVIATLSITTLRTNAEQVILKKQYYSAYNALSTIMYNIVQDIDDYNTAIREWAATYDKVADSYLIEYPSDTTGLITKFVGKAYVAFAGDTSLLAFAGNPPAYIQSGSLTGLAVSDIILNPNIGDIILNPNIGDVVVSPINPDIPKLDPSIFESSSKLLKIQNLDNRGFTNVSGSVNTTSFVPKASSSYSSYLKNSSNAPTFIASNGMRFYFSTMDSTTKDTVVWVDINGDRKPNTPDWTYNKPADIVPFLLSSDGTVVPLGYPIYDSRYLTARVVYSKADTANSKLKNFYTAKTNAFGSTIYSLDAMSKTNSNITVSTEAKNLAGTQSQDTTNCSSTGINATTEFPPCSVVIEKQNRGFFF